MTKRSSHSCVDCGTEVPPQDDESALISMKYGWRLTRKTDPDGQSFLEWRCPKCWIPYRERRGSGDSPAKPGRTGET
jgi:hypothetical protein